MQPSWQQFCNNQLDQLRQHQRLRSRGGLAGGTLAGIPQTASVHQASPLDFGSNDYLGLRNHPRVLQEIARDAVSLGWGSGASPVLSGYQSAHHQLEKIIANLSGTEDCLIFSSGFACNVGVLSCLSDERTVVFSDRLNHASLIDGIRLGKGRKFLYNHCDLEHLECELLRNRGNFSRALIVTESVFSMDGDEAPLSELVELAQRFDCGLIVDEAHAVGVFGPSGGGLLEERNLSESVMIKLGTLSKAIGGIGGYAAGCRLVIETLVNRCRSYLFSTAPPALSMLASAAAVELLTTMSSERKHLELLSIYARSRLIELGWNVIRGRSPIVPIIAGPPEVVLGLSCTLRQSGIYVPAIRPPTVPPDTCRLRISLTARHTQIDIDRLCDRLGSATAGSNGK